MLQNTFWNFAVAFFLAYIFFFFLIRFWNPSNYFCSFYILPCRVIGLQVQFASITSCTCVNVGWVDIIGWYATAMDSESSSYYLCPCTADKAPCWYLPLQLNTKLSSLLCAYINKTQQSKTRCHTDRIAWTGTIQYSWSLWTYDSLSSITTNMLLNGKQSN